jgi:response regulator NasT
MRPDLVISSVETPGLDGIAAAEEVCRDRPVPVILVAGDGAEMAPRALANECVLACLFKPLKDADLQVAISLVRHRFERLQSLRVEVADLRQALENRKLIERAKGMVMRYAHLDEEAAYNRLRRLASDQNRKLAEVAQVVIVSGEVFRELEQAGKYDRPNDAPARRPGRGSPNRNGPRGGTAERETTHVG